MSNSIELEFGDGAYLFALKVPQILELQRLCGAGIFTIYGRVLKGWYVTDGGLEFGVPQEGDAYLLDIFETIRLGLIGGGRGLVNDAEVEVSPLRAKQLVETYCHALPLVESWKTAKAILYAYVEGYEGQKKSPKPGGAKPPKGSTKRKSSQTAP